MATAPAAREAPPGSPAPGHRRTASEQRPSVRAWLQPTVIALIVVDGAHMFAPLLCLATWAALSALLVWGRFTCRAARTRQP
ncbi:hypothetical protein ACIHCM_17710 [Streptomyces sp. NPDC052023]|uniref:hypothetical protein n=1 Tax=Streptomyces sp. NPDC052023 TaxID=3365681 RepID=UPI0037D395E1